MTDSRAFKFMFGSFRCSPTLSKSEDRGSGFYVLTGHVPAFSLTGWIAPQVSVYLVIEDEEGQELNTTEIGTFTYTDVAAQPVYSPATSTPRKRKISDADETRSTTKRPTSQPLIRPKGDDYGVYSYTPSGVAGVSYSAQYPPQSSPRSYTYNGYPATSETQSQTIVAPQHMPHWAHPYPNSGTGSSVTGSIPPQSVAPSSSKIPPPTQSPQEANPPLVRTSTLQTHQNPGSTGSGSFNPYGIYPHTSKAVLNIDGDLDTVAVSHWTQEEIDNKRKLVQFWRNQKGATINTNFAVVSTSERQPNSICISCIYWEEKGECYVTSVDCIYLLESLISVRFTVEEKNRIRRNLEGFRPLTVSKAKADSENFFKLIMAFPNPKPRNIEKDVKVFPWKILGLALKKIIGKYSASYSSTAAVLPQGPNQQSYQASQGNENAVTTTETLPMAQTPALDPTSTGAPPSSHTPRTASSPVNKNPIQKDKPMTGRLNKATVDLQQSSIVHPSISNQASQMWPPPHQAPPNPKVHPGSSWDMLGYVDATGSPTVSTTSQGIHYPRGPYTSDKRDISSGAGHSLPNSGP